MKAVYRSEYGSPDVLTIREIEKPEPGKEEILIKVYATTVNRTDCAILIAKPFIMRFFTGLFRPKQKIPGTDFAGKVEEVGEAVTKFKAGDRVWGFNDNGVSSQAEYMILSEDEAIEIIPDTISYEQAAASAEGAHYAYNFIKKVKLQAGRKVLVNGATGAIGSSALQFLKYFGVYVTAVCSTENIELVKTRGADKVIDYTKEDFTNDDEKYDCVFDAVGKSTFFKCKRLLNKNGVYISSELGHYLQNPLLSLITPFTMGRRVKFPIPLDVKGSLKFIKKLLEEEKFKPFIDRNYPIEKIHEAYEYVSSGQKIGNVIITFVE